VRVLVVNAGSSSLKLRLLDAGDEGDTVVESADLPAGAQGFDRDAVASTLAGWGAPDAVGHRIVHGGTIFTGPVVLDDDVEQKLRGLVDLAPLHQPKSLAGIDAVDAVVPDVPAVACFDTAFHATLPPAASVYALPREWRERYGLRRYGFHGLSHGYSARRVPQLADRPVRRLVSAHLGAGASLTAIVDGRSVDTSMGFTPLEGLVMATRSGSVDPGLVLWLEEHEGISAHEVAEVLEHRSGLLALAGTADLREITARNDADARLALAVYVHHIAAGVGAMAVSAGGIDALSFTGGVGENSAQVRAAVCDRLRFLGVDLDRDANGSVQPDAVVSMPSSSVLVVLVAAREDLEIARQTSACLS
jgi:acetate kinase